MIFKRLELFGFKSFADKTALQFEPGVTAIVGPNGCGKCISGSSEVCLGDGSRVKIKDLVESAFKKASNIEKLDDGYVIYSDSSDFSILSLNPQTLQIEPKPVHAFVKRTSPGYLLKIKTKTGREVITTHYHPFFSIKESNLINLKAEQLKAGTKIAVLRILRMKEPKTKSYLSGMFKKFKNEDSMYIPFVGAKSHKLDVIRLLKYKTNLNLDLIPEVNQTFRTLVKLSGIKVKRFRKISPKLASYYEDRCLPSRQGLLEALSIVAEHGRLNGLAKSIFDYLKMLANSDIYWDEIVSIKKIYSEKWVYDLSILGNHNFIAQDIIVHNSNVSDSIRWVLGEQSARLLRGTKMEDIIFNGTDTKSAVNLAEVTLVLSNEKKILPLDYDEISVTRRLYRSGESEYLLNRTPVRLKDILELFMDTGIGTEAYSLIEQGKIDQILSSKPDERRVVFEEAAGITKYKTKKKEALRKLEQTEANLLRVNDIIVEVGRQVSAVERQAQKATRYKEEFEKLKEMEIKFTLIEFNKLNSELENIRVSLAELAGREKVKVEENSRLHSRLAELRQDLTRHDQDLTAIRSRHSAIVHQIDKDKSYLPLLNVRQEELNSHREDIAEEISTLQKKVSSLNHEESQTKNELELLIEDKGIKEKQRQEKLVEQERLSKEIQVCHDEIARSKVELIDIASRQSRAHNELTKAGSELHSLQGRVKRLQLDKAESDRLLKEVEERLTLSGSQRDALNEKVEALRQERKNLEGRLKELHQELTALTQSVIQLKENLAGLNSKREFLEDLKKRYEGFGAGVKALLRDRDQGVLKLDGFYGPLANILEVERGYEQAVESALGKSVESLVVDNLNIAGEALNYLEANQLGEATFLYLDNPWQAEVESCPDPASLPEVKGRAIDFVRTEPRFQQLVSSLLKGVIVVEKMGDARNLYSRGIICTIVTLKGEVLKPGSISGGFRFSPAEAGLLGREARIRDLAGAIQHLQEELIKIKDEEQLKDKSLQDSESYLGQLADSTHLQEIELTNAEAKLANIGQEKKRLNDEVSIINLELSEATDEEARLKETEEKQRGLLTELEEGKIRLEKAVNDSQERIKLITGQREAILIENATLQTVLTSLSESIERLGRTRNSIISEIAAQENMLRQRSKDLEECIQKDEETKTEQARLEKEIERLTVEEENVRKEEESAAVKRQDVYKEIEGMEARFQNEQEILEGLRNGMRDLELKSNEKTYSIQSLKDRMLASYRVDLNEVQAEPEPGLDTVQLQEEILVLKKKIEDMGTVNLAAVEEHKELQERFSFLTAQQADLVNAKESLLKAIQKINQTTKELFMDTFKKIQETFQEFFRLLFGGGEAELVLVGEEDVLEAGVEIIARPPGKKQQNITLLSGGEKALTAISLLFAIFKVKPSPFCVLDEIDAPLDESNVDRFTRVLHEFVKTSQFIIITHNKKTIGMADVMYGVTMEQSGVSKIVSVKFKEDNSQKEVEIKAQ